MPSKKKIEEAVVATEIEAKKTARAAGKTAEEAVKETAKEAEKVAKETAEVATEAIKETAKEIAESDPVVATEIEVKKAARKAGRDAKETAKKVAAAVEEKAVAEEIEVKKTVRKAGRKAKEAVEAKKPARHTKLDIIVQSPMGGVISADDIAKKLPKGVETVYVRVDENKLYWVKGDETGSVDIWE